MFEQGQTKQRQQELWIVAGELPAATPDAFYKRVNRTLEKMDFSPQVWAICKPAYAEAAKGGRPGIGPVVYLKMLMVGFFENIGSERGIASRCADSLSIRGYLGYSLARPLFLERHPQAPQPRSNAGHSQRAAVRLAQARPAPKAARPASTSASSKPTLGCAAWSTATRRRKLLGVRQTPRRQGWH